VSSVLSGLKQWYNEINPATLTGAIDVIVVEQADGTFVSSPFHVRFGKLGVLKAKEKIVDLEVNGEPVNIHMKLDDNGAAFFVEGLDESEIHELPAELATSPIPTETSNFDDAPKWDEAQRETVNRNLSIEFDAENTTHETDTTDDASAINRNQKFNQSKNKRNKKRRSKHSRSSSKASLKEFFPDSSIATSSTPVPTTSNSDNSQNEQGQAVVPPSDSEQSFRVRHKSSTEKNLLLSRLPIEPEIMDSIATDTDQEIKEMNLEAAGSVRSSLPLNIERQFNYFSEPEISPGTSPMGSRPGSPDNVMSDSEFETGKRGSISGSGGSGGKKEAEQSWEWGQLPSSITPTHGKNSNKNSEKNKQDDGIDPAGKNIEPAPGWFGGLFGSKKNREDDHQPGIYLDDLQQEIQANTEIAEIYLGSRNRTRSGRDLTRDLDTEDAESGTGPSLPMSPHSVVGAIGFNPVEHESYEPHLSIQISNCGGLEDFSSALFEQSKVSFDDFVIQIETNPNLLTDPSLVIKIGDTYHKWDTAAPIIMSHVLYGRSLPLDLMEKLKEKSTFKRGKSTPTPEKDKADKVAEGSSDSGRERKSSSWWPFGGKKPEDSDALQDALSSTPSKIETAEDAAENLLSEVVVNVTDEIQNNRKRRNETTSSSEGETDADKFTKNEKWKKTLKLPKDAIKFLNLNQGANEIQFSVTTAYQGTTKCYCHVYLWHHSDKIVISDIDGTITKSDVLGHVFPMIGRDWAQSGVASLFTKIADNGYKIVYLSARAIGQASITKEYLASVKQGEVNLPDGPIFLNPTSLVNAFHREVIEKKPEAFKIACLRDIRSLFPEATNPNPFYAGYGNRVNDVWAYQAVGIPMSRIFTINPRGELRHELTNAFRTSYGSMTSIVDHVFPPTSQSPQMALDYSSFTFWREPLPNIIAEEESSGNPVVFGIEPETEIADDNNIEKIPSNHDCNSNANKNDGELNTSDTSSPSSSSSQTTIVENVILETDSNQIVH